MQLSAGRMVAEREEILDSKKITHIVNMASQFDNKFPDKYTYFRIDEEDRADVNLMKYFEDTFKFIDEGREKGRVLVHCNHGISRAATMVTGYVMRSEGMKRDEAIEFAQSKRNNPVDPKEGFLQQLQTLEERLYNENVIKH